jgi:hypothetical protein
MLAGWETDMKIYGKERPTDENASFSDMERVCHGFFKTTHGKRESYSVHRGFLIVRATTEICRVPTRMTSVFMFLPEGHEDSGRPDLFCVSGCVTLRSISQAKRYIDDLLAHGDYSYGWQREVVSQ